MTLVIRIAIVLSFAMVSSFAQAAERPDKTMSPYFYVPSGNPELDLLPLKETRAKVDIAGVVAKVVVTQVYVNLGNSPIEAIYVFPGSTRAAVTSMEMQVGKHIIKAKIQTRKQAAQTYKDARAKGKTASLLQQERPNVFKMQVANIMPKERVEVRLQYVETLVPSNGVYEFVYPTVVGPRFSNEPQVGNTQNNWIENPTLREGKKATYQWDIEASLKSGIGIRDLQSPSHKLATKFPNKNEAIVDVDDASGGNRDFVLRYRLQGSKIETGLMLFPGAKESFFLAMVQPPKNVRPQEIPTREYIFIVDNSGSMGGFPMEATKKLMKRVLKGLKPKDRLNLMMFAGGNSVWKPKSVAATSKNISAAMHAVGSMRGSGSTQILGALKEALAMPRQLDMATTFVVVTDGYVSVEDEAFELIKSNLGEASLFTFGVGSSVNRHLIEGMARAGMGEPFIALNPSEASRKAAEFSKYIASPVLTNVKVAFNGFAAYDVTPKSFPDVFSSRPVLIFGKYQGTARGKIVLTGTGGKGKHKVSIDVATQGKSSKDNSALKYLWARHRIQELEDKSTISGSDTSKTIEKLGLKYSLMTAHTSFVAVDPRVRNTKGAASRVRQVLPLPQGVSGNAVGSTAGGYGYGLGGAGVGGGGSGWGTVGTGSYGTIGHGSVAGTGYGTARGRKAKPASVRAGNSMVQGALSKEIIRRYLRRKLGRIRHCYEMGLIKNPKLQGTVTVRFIINATGKVESVLARGLGDKAVQSCISIAVKAAKFPKPPGGRVQVTYPFHLQPSK